MKLLKIFLLVVLCTAQGGFAVEQPALLVYVDKEGKQRPVHNLEEWEIKRQQILDSMETVMGPLPDRRKLPPLNVQYKDSVKEKNYVRYTIDLTVAKDQIVPAYLYVPEQTGTIKKRPAMLALHPTGSLGKKIVDGQSDLQNRAYAKELADRGYVVIAPDYPDFGDLQDYDFQHDGYESGTMKSIFDDMRCIDFLESRSDVDPRCIGVIGHSLGGHGAMFVAAFDMRLKVVVSSCGWTLMHYYFNGDSAAAKKDGGKLWPWAQERYMPLFRTKYRLDPDKIPFDFDEVIAAIAPRAFFSNSPVYDANFNVAGVKKGIENVSKVYQFLGVENEPQVRYPPSSHDFPPSVRGEAYQFIDSVFGFNPRTTAKYSYLDNAGYLIRLEQFSRQEGDKKIVMLGNSLTARGDWPKILGRQDVANQGIGSDITWGFINRIDYVFNLHPKICFIEGGLNDLVHDISVAEIAKNLAILIDTLRQRGIIPVLNTATIATSDYRYIDPKIFNHKIEGLNKEIVNLAQKKKVKIIDLNPIVSDGQYRQKKYAVADGIHYTTETYALWQDKIDKILVEFDLNK